MKVRRKGWYRVVTVLLSVIALAVISLILGGSLLRRRLEPYVRKKAISYLSKRFDSDVTLSSLHIQIPPVSRVHILLTGGRGTLARVEGTGLILHQKQMPGLPPILTLRHFTFDVDMGTVFDSPPSVDRIVLEGMVLTIPPKNERAPLQSSSQNASIREVVAKDSRLVILPKTAGKEPLTFLIKDLHLQSAGSDQAMKYAAVLTNPKPQGLIRSAGDFGPWVAEDPGNTPLSGDYSFDHADLSVFSGIAGLLHSTGSFSGTLSAINAKGRASIPDFRLKNAGNPVPLQADFEVLVDGGNGNTTLNTVHATLGSTQFTTSGGVIKQNGDARRSIALDVTMPAGDLRDVLRLAMNGEPFMEGKIALLTKIGIPPLGGKVREKLMLDGRFEISNGRFLRSGIQSKIDALSRRGQGQPQNEEIAEVFARMKGRFRFQDQTITFRNLSFATPGAAVKLAGDYDLANDSLDFHGSLGLQARVSQTVTGWKRWVLKPVDPFFAKNGSGTFLRIKIGGSSKSPEFGLDFGKPDQPKETEQPEKSERQDH
jgi:hypothetical protein